MKSSTERPVVIHDLKSKALKGKVMAGIVALCSITLFSCQKEMASTPDREDVSMLATKGNILGMYSGLPSTTMWELQQARAASAKYQRLENALRDGYVDINVVIPGMGRHYLKESLVDDVFDPRMPEILVYNTVDGKDNVLVAVEYGFPIALSPGHQPDGYTGDHDHWAKNEGVGMWLLHAWVWKYNPDGVFAHMNPDVP
ncbi:MAG TPA: hypothetical protein VK907_12360 [Phnomibacter sp.]|nr:hypothetical protein [Phnomibacter sp.]